MNTRMPIFCSHCGYANELHYRFCGMCGTSLAEPSSELQSGHDEPAAEASQRESTEAASRGSERPPSPRSGVSGPSFLGLGDEPRSGTNYLLEDEPEPPRGRGRMILAFLILLVAGSVLAWRFYGGRIAGLGHAPASPIAGSNLPPPSAGSAAASPTPANPPSETDLPPANSPQTAANPPADLEPNSPEHDPPPPTSESASSESSDAAGNSHSDSGKESPSSAAVPEARPPTIIIKRQPLRKLKPTPAITAPASGDALAAEGEKYLYGTGVPHNCARAQKSLLSAAQMSNAHAQSVLGTMYATGHCVSRDVPAAYRWFAKALRQDPNNGRISRDLEILWKQMTPEEKQIASARQ